MASFDNEQQLGNFAQESFDLSTLPPNVPSLCIPRVFKNITRERVFNCFKELGIGFVERIDMVPRTAENGDQFQRVFVHLRWNKGEQASKARTRLLAGKEIKIIYDEPWFWKVSANRSVSRDKPLPRDSAHALNKPRATLALDDDDAEEQDGALRNAKAQNDRDRRDFGKRPNGPQRAHHNRKADHTRVQKQDQKQDFVPRSPSASPPQTPRLSSNAPASAIYDYGVAVPLQRKKKGMVVKKPIAVIVEDAAATVAAEDLEEGEI